MTLRTGKGGRYRYYTYSTKARQGGTRCRGRAAPMEKLDTLVADHLERRLLDPDGLEEILAAVLHRREEWAERRAGHVTELRRRAAEAEAKLKRLYDAIEAGVADPADPMPKDRIAELTTVCDQAHADAERAEATREKVGATVTPSQVKTFATEARRRMRTHAGGYCRDHLRAPGQRVEVGQDEVRIVGSKTELLRTLTAAGGGKSAAFGVRSFIPQWRALVDSNHRPTA